jgi:hypothetical protein
MLCMFIANKYTDQMLYFQVTALKYVYIKVYICRWGGLVGAGKGG